MSIRISALSKSFDATAALTDVSLDIPQGKFCCVVGPSGCGKSTLLRLIAGLETPDRGEIALEGKRVTGPALSIPPEDRRVGVVFQSYALWPHLSVLQNVAFPYEARGVSRREAARLAAAHLETVSLAAHAQRKPAALSGGQRQRVALARCLAGNARTILMDEPLANLDPHLRDVMESELRDFHNKAGVTTLYITHDQREAMALADTMAVMFDGTLVQTGTPAEIYERPRIRQAAEFIGRGVLLETDISNGAAYFQDQTIPVESTASGRQALLIRPECVEVAETGWPVQIDSAYYRGGHWEAIAYGAGVSQQIPLDLPQAVKPGEWLHLRFLRGWVVPD